MGRRRSSKFRHASRGTGRSSGSKGRTARHSTAHVPRRLLVVGGGALNHQPALAARCSSLSPLSGCDVRVARGPSHKGGDGAGHDGGGDGKAHRPADVLLWGAREGEGQEGQGREQRSGGSEAGCAGSSAGVLPCLHSAPEPQSGQRASELAPPHPAPPRTRR
jgi:hypothetical protein